MNLSRFADESFDTVLILGPLYHLYEKADIDSSINEALRVVKKGGFLYYAFLSVHAILYVNYLGNDLKAGICENFNSDYSTKHFEKQLFTGYDIDEFEHLFDGKNIEELKVVSADNILEFVKHKTNLELSDDDFKAFEEYHFATCEKRELLGFANHLIFIGKKK